MRWLVVLVLWGLIGAAVAQEPESQPAAVCGNGAVEDGEQCDDGSANHDEYGPCKTTCELLSTSVCGNGKREGAETCDDGNRRSGDGCSAICKKERVAAAPTPRIVPTPSPSQLKDPDVAFRRSIVYTIFLLPLGSPFWAPSAGHWYAEEKSHAVGFTIARLTAGATILAGFSAAGFGLDNGGTGFFGGFIGFSGVVALDALIIYDLLDGPKAVERYNARLSAGLEPPTLDAPPKREPPRLRLAITPVLNNGDLVPGLGVGARW